MKSSDKVEFTAIYKSAMEVYDKELSFDALSIWWATMADLSIEDFRKAMIRHITTSPFFPKPADILKSFRKDDKPGAEEAWSMMPKNEYDSVVWTNEMAIAFGAASPLINDGDAIGARMAFKEVYEREIEKNNPTKWFPSFGMDKQGRESALQKAVSMKRLSADQAINYMTDSEQLLQLVAPDKPILENLDRIKQIVTNKPTETEPDEHVDESVLIARVKAILK